MLLRGRTLPLLAASYRRPPADHGFIAASLMHVTIHVLADTHLHSRAPLRFVATTSFLCLTWRATATREVIREFEAVRVLQPGGHAWCIRELRERCLPGLCRECAETRERLFNFRRSVKLQTGNHDKRCNCGQRASRDPWLPDLVEVLGPRHQL
mgnify:CR=1 FL=1